MISGGNATIYVSDLDRAIRFFIEIMAFKLHRDREGAPDGGWAEVDAGDGLILGLHAASSHGPKPGAPGAISIGLHVNIPIHEAVAVLENRGVQFHGPIMKGKGPRLAFFGDPDGNPFYLYDDSVGEGAAEQVK